MPNNTPVNNVIAFPSRVAEEVSRLTRNERADLVRWETAAAAFGIVRVAVYAMDTEDEFVSIGEGAGHTLALVFRPPGERQFVALLTDTPERDEVDLGSFGTLLDALTAVRPVLLESAA